jgi:hypothetical protein
MANRLHLLQDPKMGCTVFSDRHPGVFTDLVTPVNNGDILAARRKQEGCDGRAMGRGSKQIEGGVAGTPGVEQTKTGRSRVRKRLSPKSASDSADPCRMPMLKAPLNPSCHSANKCPSGDPPPSYPVDTLVVWYPLRQRHFIERR